jgi:hypothetical protein
MKHRFSRERFAKELSKRGWRKDPSLGIWIAPIEKSALELERDQVIAIEASIVCVPETIANRGLGSPYRSSLNIEERRF